MFRKSHKSVLEVSLKEPFITGLVSSPENTLLLNEDLYVQLVKHVYCPQRLDASAASYEEVRRTTIYKGKTTNTNLPQQWLPPESVMQRVATLIQLQIKYLETAGIHDAPLPDFLSYPCFRKTATGEVEYDFGQDVHMSSLQMVVTCTPKKDKKRMMIQSPQKGNNRKKNRTSTPAKSKKQL